MENKAIEQLLNTEDEHVKKLHEIVIKAIEEEGLLSDKIREFEDTKAPFSGRVADAVAQFGGSWTFILVFAGIMLFWIGVNVWLLSKPFDPYPFILLNLLLSTIAALQAPIIMMSQNRKEEKDRKREINDYLVNLKAEIEIRNVHAKLDLLIVEQMKTLFALQREQLDLIEDIQKKMSNPKSQS